MYNVGSLHNNYYPVWSPQGDIIAECLNYEDAEMIVKALNLYTKIKESI